ncbi:MAG: GNAT family N-acetyltransferase, partial [Planctomycetota bacterium]
MKPICLHDKTEIEVFFRHDSFLHIYEIGDLDEFFWPYTTWYAIKNNGDIKAVALVYTNCDLPVLVALSDDNRSPMSQLLESLVPFLPRCFDAHLSLGLETIIEDRYESDSHGLHYKMALKDSSLLTRVNTS